jgi:hypothetical protein
VEVESYCSENHPITRTYLNIQYPPQTSRITLVQHPSNHHGQQNLLRDEINSDAQAETIGLCDETRVDGGYPFYRALGYTWVEGRALSRARTGEKGVRVK